MSQEENKSPTSPNRVSRKLTSATVAAAAIYAGAGTVQADVVENTNGFVLTGPGTTQFWDIDGNGSNEFRLGIADGQGGFFPYTMYWGDASNFASNALVNNSGDPAGFFRNLATGVTIGPTLGGGYAFGTSQVRSITASGTFQDAQGFTSGQNGFVGFRFQGAGGTAQFGWAEVNFTPSNSQAHRLEVVRWAYDDAGNSIQAGVIPEPGAGALAVLACGMAGVRRWRRRK